MRTGDRQRGRLVLFAWLAMGLAALVGILAVLARESPPASAEAPASRPPLDIRLFARVPNPGQPEAIAVAKDGTVYVGTNQQQRGDADAPSQIFAYSPRGALIRQYVISGQDLDQPHGIQGIAIDGGGTLYALDRAADPRVITLTPGPASSATTRTSATSRVAPSPDAPTTAPTRSETWKRAPTSPPSPRTATCTSPTSTRH